MKEMKANKETNSNYLQTSVSQEKSQMLDEQIDLKVKMKSILSVDQFEKWDAMKGKQKNRRTQRMQKNKTEWIAKKDMQK
jgi:hypothetical protein